MSVFSPDRTSQLESWAFRIERSVESVASTMTDMFNKILGRLDQLQEQQSLLVNSFDSLHKRLDTVELAQKDLKSELKDLKSDIGAVNKKLDQVLMALNKKGL